MTNAHPLVREVLPQLPAGGPTYAYDETHYLSDDGDHPNAAGHKQIAAAAEAVIESVLHI
jgi:lysophospholipase L1-like esterase